MPDLDPFQIWNFEVELSHDTFQVGIKFVVFATNH